MSYFDPSLWTALTAQQVTAFLQAGIAKADTERRPRRRSTKGHAILVVQKQISPFDFYTYLYGRFGEPNGLMTRMARDDSNNLFHWDYWLKAGDRDLKFTGLSEEVHIAVDRPFSDAQWIRLIRAIKSDFARSSKEKGRFARSLEKWSIFPNQYLTIANRCSQLYHIIDDALPKIEKLLEKKLTVELIGKKRNQQQHSKYMTAITEAPTELSVLAPVMFESFIGFLVAALVKTEFKNDTVAYEKFVRSPLNVKLTRLSEVCSWFMRPIEQNNPVFGRYWSVVNKRNDIIHGNVDPVRDAVDVVYFHGKRPLFRTGGDRLAQHWRRLLEQYKPREVADDYLATHEFILEIMDHLIPPVRNELHMLLRDTQPGWDNSRRRMGRLFPDVVATVTFDEMFYDWQLKQA